MVLATTCRAATVAAVLGASCLPAGLDAASNGQWHQWRGPLASGVAPEASPPTHWDERTNVRWKTELPGSGSSTPIVWDDHVFILAAVETDREASDEELAAAGRAADDQKTHAPTRYYRFLVLDIDRRTGELRWERTACEALPHEGIQSTNTYASASPVTDGRRVYAFFGSRGLYCYDFEGNLVWSRDLGDMRTRYGWGEGASPAIFEDSLYVNWDHEGQSFLAALDTASGEVKWKTERDEPTSWSTPLVVSRGGATQIVVAATNRIFSYDASSGEVVWECDGLTTNVIASPVATEDAAICLSWYGEAKVKAISLDARGDASGTDAVLWQYELLAPYCPSPLLYDGKLFFNRANTSVFVGLDARTGETEVGPARLPGLNEEMYASPVAVAGRIYFLGRDGTAVVLQCGTELELLAVNRLADGFDASPAMVGNQMLLRGRRFLYCLEEKETSGQIR